MTGSGKILVTCKQMQEVIAEFLPEFEDRGYKVATPELTGQSFTADELLELCDGNVDGIIAGDDELNAHFFENAKNLSVVIRWGIGTDSVDFAAAKQAGVVVKNTPGVFGDEVADLAFTYLLLLARGAHRIHNSVMTGNWPKLRGISLAGNTIGIVGFGAIGRATAKRALGFGLTPVAYDPYVTATGAADDDVTLVGLEELLRVSRFVVLTCPATPETTGMINAETLSMMRSNAFLINVGRGSLVQEEPLVAALLTNQIAGAALDVFEEEPLPIASGLRELEQVVLGAHNASNTIEGVMRASRRSVEILFEVLDSDG